MSYRLVRLADEGNVLRGVSQLLLRAELRHFEVTEGSQHTNFLDFPLHFPLHL